MCIRDSEMPDLGFVPYSKYQEVVTAAQAYCCDPVPCWVGWPNNSASGLCAQSRGWFVGWSVQAKAHEIIDAVKSDEREFPFWRVEWGAGGHYQLRVWCNGEGGKFWNMFGFKGTFTVHEDVTNNDDVVHFHDTMT